MAVALSGAVLIAPDAIADPGNPTDAEISQSKQDVNNRAAEVGRATAALVRAEANVAAAATRAEVAAEKYNKARVDEQMAAKATAAAAREATAAKAQLQLMIARMDKVAASNYKSAGSLGPLTAVVTSDNPGDVLHDAGLLSVMGDRQIDGLKALDRARTRQVNALSAAKAALIKQAAARKAAESAKLAAEKARTDSQRIAVQFATQKSVLEQKLAAAQAHAGLLLAARKAAVERARAEAAARARAAAAARAARRASGRGSGGGSGHHVPGGSAAAIAVNAALSQLGKPYVWGAAGPDSYDCSGLMLWSYAHAGIYLPHFSGYQYQSGQHIPLSALIPGDMVFYSNNGSPSGIHHVAMYIGGGSMVEAATEGIPVRVHVMYYSGLLPLGTRPY